MADDELAVRKARAEQAMSDAYMGKALVHRFDDHVPKVVDVPICGKHHRDEQRGESFKCGKPKHSPKFPCGNFIKLDD
jgi:hypothetical protein